MKMKKTLAKQLMGVNRLAVEATRNVTDLVETMHQNIGAGPDVLGRPLESLTRFFIAPTYGAIRGVTSFVGAGLDLALTKIEPLLDRPGEERGLVLAAINGVLGDYLADTDNPLAIEMCLCWNGKPLDLSLESLSANFPEGDRLLILLHGSSIDETSWLRKGHDHGAALAGEFGFIPLYLRYNSGLHISQNGRAFASMLETLVARWPRLIDKMILIGHSMGGLVARSACLISETEELQWGKSLSSLITIGSPHHGAPLERGGNWIDTLLGIHRYSAPLTRLARLRSAGVTDLRYGNVLDEHWQGRDRFSRTGDPRGSMTLPSGVDCFAIGASTATVWKEVLPGDGLVPVDSSLGKHKNPAMTLDFADSHRWIALGTNHLGLLNSPEVYEKLCEWVRPLSLENQGSPR